MTSCQGLGFIFVITLALSWPLPGRELGTPMSGDFPIAQTCCIVVIFFISGLTLKTDEVKRALTSWPDALFGVVSILLITPLLALLLPELHHHLPDVVDGVVLRLLRGLRDVGLGGEAPAARRVRVGPVPAEARLAREARIRRTISRSIVLRPSVLAVDEAVVAVGEERAAPDSPELQISAVSTEFRPGNTPPT